INAMLLFNLLKRFSGELWICFFIAAAFAVHPLRVESVAWIAERKDVLAAFFYLLTITAYLRYAGEPDFARYIFTILIFTFGLMAKPMVITLPCVLFIMDIWPLNRCKAIKFDNVAFTERICKETTITRLIMEKIPFAVLSVLVIGLWKFSLGTITSVKAVPFKLRLANAVVSYFSYIKKTVFPVNLAPFYPYPKSIPIWQSLTACVALVVITIVLLKIAKKKPYLCFGWLWYLVTLVPVIGLLQSGTWPAVADRFTYLPSIGIYIMVAFSAADIAKHHGDRIIVLKTLAILALLAMMAVTWIYTLHWQNNITLYGRAVKVTKNNSIMHNNFGQELVDRGFLDDGKKQFEKALAIEPDYLSAINNLSIVLLKQGELDSAITGFKRVIKGGIEHPEEVYCNLANAYAEKGDTETAIKYFNEAIHIKPDYALAINNLAMALKQQDRVDLAVIKWQRVLEIEPDFYNANYNLAMTFAELKEFGPAIRYLQKVIRLNPSGPKAYDTLAEVYAQTGDFEKAVQTAQKAVELALEHGDGLLVDRITQKLQLYKASQP
ncbi:MAG: tetratricopeptide repeat protein, partial [Sedimentisphaerales bacterium]|nr:tetratricopeptide repeat protein [Sedimentisphaerales bacterium]